MDPKNSRYARALGFLRFYQGDFKGASVSLLQAVELRNDPYVMIMLYLARKRTGESAEAELEANIKRLQIKVWPYAFAELYLGRRSPDALLEAATTPSYRCQAQFFIGEWKILNSDVPEGVKLLTAAVEICSKDAIESKAAIAELKRLKL
jgi:lipoprotein NlpI